MARIGVRRAEAGDLSALLALGREMRSESAIPFPEIDEEAARDMLALLGGLYFVAVAELVSNNGSKEIIGLLTAQPMMLVFSREWFVQHDILYVRPRWRGSRAAILLIRALERWADEVGSKRVVLGVHTGLVTERTGRFYERLGYQHMGGNYMKEVI
jgi:GNAT superfamily N-acetyltransferase